MKTFLALALALVCSCRGSESSEPDMLALIDVACEAFCDQETRCSETARPIGVCLETCVETFERDILIDSERWPTEECRIATLEALCVWEQSCAAWADRSVYDICADEIANTLALCGAGQ